jgi:hypothetical protein
MLHRALGLYGFFESDVRMDLGEIWCEDVDWMHLAQDNQWRAVVNTVMNLWVP